MALADEATIDREVSRIMTEIDGSFLASSDVPRQTTLDYYDALIDRITSQRDTVREELEDEAKE